MKQELPSTHVTNTTPTGFPSPAQDYLKERISLDKEYIKHPLSTFFFEASGVSMINAFIPHGSRLLVDRSLTAKNGDIIVAKINGEYIVKFLKKNECKCWLCSANSKYQQIEITEEMNMEVFGVVTTILIDTNTVRRCML